MLHNVIYLMLGCILQFISFMQLNISTSVSAARIAAASFVVAWIVTKIAIYKTYRSWHAASV
jgi:uncharacterized membrane protein (DUF485 family)